MQYDKPKVTIDLAEYESLKRDVDILKTTDIGEEMVLLKKTVYVLASNLRPDDFWVNTKLAEEGVILYMNHNSTERDGYKKVFVSKIKKA